MSESVSVIKLIRSSWQTARRRFGKMIGYLLLIGLVQMLVAIPLSILIRPGVAAGGPNGAPGVSFQQQLQMQTSPAMLSLGLMITLISLPFIIGFFTEIYRPEVRIGRGIAAGFERFPAAVWIALGALPFMLANAVIARALADQLILLLLFFLPLNVFYSLLYTFALPAAAAGSPRQTVTELCRNTFAAFRRGWWRLILGWLVLVAAMLGAYATILLPVVVTVAKKHFEAGMLLSILTVIVWIVWIIALIFVLLRFACTWVVFIALLYQAVVPEAITPEAITQETVAAETASAEAPAAPAELPATDGKDHQDGA